MVIKTLPDPTAKPAISSQLLLPRQRRTHSG